MDLATAARGGLGYVVFSVAMTIGRLYGDAIVIRIGNKSTLVYGSILAIIGLGLFPVGAAFYTWDLGVKRGDIMVLGAASYASPLLSTLVLLVSGYAAFHWTILAACLLITFGAIIAAKDMFKSAARGP